MKLSDKIYLILRNRIVNLVYPPETRLIEEELCKEFQVSRTPLREALQRLSEMNLVQSIPRFGTIIKPVNFNEVRNAYEVKVHLEYLAGTLAAQRITPVQLKALKQIREAFKLAIDKGEGTSETELNFHEVVYEATHNDVLEDTLKKLTARCVRLCHILIPHHIDISQDLIMLFELYEALKARNADLSAKICQDHAQHYLNLLREEAI